MMSSANRVWPVTFARPSTRRRGRPMTRVVLIARSLAPAGVPHPGDGRFDGFEDLQVAGAAAEVARERLANPLARRLRVPSSSALAVTRNAGRAVAALRAAQVGEGFLQRMQRPSAASPSMVVIDRAVALDAEHQAREHRLAVDEHRARAALAQLAAVLGAGELQVLPQHFEQRLRAVNERDGRLAVDRDA